jgi:hypothetical protein
MVKTAGSTTDRGKLKEISHPLKRALHARGTLRMPYVEGVGELATEESAGGRGRVVAS